MNKTKIKIDKELEELLPALSEEEYKALEDSILNDGLQDAIKIWTNPDTEQNLLVDGHNRYMDTIAIISVKLTTLRFQMIRL